MEHIVPEVLCALCDIQTSRCLWKLSLSIGLWPSGICDLQSHDHGYLRTVFTLQQGKMKQKRVERLYIAIKKAEGRALVDGTCSEVQLWADANTHVR